MIYWCHGLEHVPRPLVIPTLKKLYLASQATRDSALEFARFPHHS